MKKIPNIGCRAIAPPEIKLSGDLVTVSFSSEAPLQRGFGLREILDHSEGSVDLNRIQSGKVLFNHDPEVILGKVERAWIENKRGYAEIRLKKQSDLPQVSEQLANIKDGFLDQTSIYYEIFEEGIKFEEDDENIYRVFKWAPIEVTFTPIPADPGVGLKGIFRSFREFEIMPKSIETTAPENIKHPTDSDPQQSPKFSIEEMRSKEENRWQGIRNLAGQFGESQLAETAIREGTSLEEFKDHLLKQVAKRSKDQGGAIASAQSPFVGLDNGEKKKYSLTRAIAVASNVIQPDRAGLELEVSEHIANKFNKGKPAQGIFIPTRDIAWYSKRATYSTTVPGAAGNLVETELRESDFIEALRNRAVVSRLGARMLGGLTGNVSLPRRSGVSSAYWVDEGSNIPESNASFDNVLLTPKQVGALSSITRLMLQQSTPDIEQLTRYDLVYEIALAIDRAALNGSGVGSEPLGILNTPGIGNADVGTNGGPLAWANVVQLETEIAVDNADEGSCYYVTNAVGRGKLKVTEKATATGLYLWDDISMLAMMGAMDGGMGTPMKMGYMNGYGAVSSNQIPSNLTKGSGTDLSAVIFGDFTNVLIGEWGTLDILPNPYGAGYEAGNIQLRIMQTLDIQLRRPEYFAAVKDFATT